MGCGCKSKGSVKSTDKKVEFQDNIKDKKTSLKIEVVKILRVLFIAVILTIAVPFIWLILMVIVVKSYYGKPFDLMGMINGVVKKGGKKEEFETELDPNDFELVGVDKID